MSDPLQSNDMTPRDTAILKLEDVKQDLLAANDIKAAEMIEQVISILASLGEFNDDTQTVVSTALANLGQAVSHAGSRLKNASDVTVATASQLVTQAGEGFANAKDLLVDKANELRRSTLVAGASSGLGIAAQTLTKFAENLDWSTIDPTKYLYAGTRGISRGMDQAMLVWESIPEPLRALDPEELL
ncbi:MAG: hypothetical protein F4W90_00460 [Gammaproteobacteria bacterium]|nr:hypothetical protein [Gammaproteobacteria bacterium]